MKKWIVLLTGLIAASALSVQSADAHWRHKKVGKGVVVAGVVTGAAATAGYFALNGWKWKWDGSRSGGYTQTTAIVGTTIACAAVAPMLASAFEGRELSLREAGVLTGGCIVPIIGGYLVNAIWDANPQWERFEKKPKRFAKRLF